MGKIKRDFIIRELRSLVLLMLLMALALGYIVWYVKISPLAFLLLPLVIIAFVIRMNAVSSGAVRGVCSEYSELWQERVGRQYASPHPVYKVAYGELHLLDDCLVCRNKRRLLLIPTEQIVSVDVRRRSVGVKKVPLLKFTLDTDKTVDIDFSVRHCEDAEAALSRLNGRIRRAAP